MILNFVDRLDELGFLEERFLSGKPEFIVIYGRRRVGKTELIKQFLKDKEGFYFLARKEDLELELDRFKERFSKKFNVYLDSSSWDELFEGISRFIGDRRFILVIDEFSYWMEEDSKICSIFQSIWDEILSKTNCFLILCGSIFSMMESLLSYRNPLYGRRSGQWKLSPLGFFDIKGFFPGYSVEDLVKVYGCLDGIPFYLLEFNPDFSVEENIEKTFLNKGCILYEDAERILRDELREPVVYLNIMRCINEGVTTLSEISNKTGVGITNLPKYLNVLNSMNLIRKEYPVTMLERKTRKGLYVVADNYFKFWLRFIYPYKDGIEIGSYSFESFKKEYNRYIGRVFEDVSRQFLIKLNKDIGFTRIGRWWYKDEEIDIVALDEQKSRILFFESKWSNLNSRDARRVLRDLERKSEKVEWVARERKLGLVAKHVEDKEDLREEGYLVYDLRDLQW